MRPNTNPGTGFVSTHQNMRPCWSRHSAHGPAIAGGALITACCSSDTTNIGVAAVIIYRATGKTGTGMMARV